MRLGLCSISATLVAGFVLLALPSQLTAQQPDPSLAVLGAEALPESPQPVIALAEAEPAQQTPSTQSQNNQSPPNPSSAQSPASAGSSSSQTPAAQTPDEKSLHDKAEEQLKEQEHQRVAGLMATFNTTRNKDALPLSSGQKFRLFFKSATDPWPFGLASVVAGIGQADNSNPSWGQGVKGYAKRYGAAYSDYFIGNFFGNAVLPSLLHEDPRYFQMSTGPAVKRALWAAASTAWCKRDRGGWGPNWSNLGGNLIGAAIARSYYPASERTVTSTVTDGLTVSAEGIVGAEVIEFWPDLARHFKQKHAEKLARQAGRGTAPAQ